MHPNTSGSIPTVSRRLKDGTLIELLFDPDRGETAFAVGGAGQGAQIVPDWTLPSGEVLVPYRADNTLIASGCVLLPSGLGELLPTRELIGAIEGYLDRYVDLDPGFRTIAAYYALMTWVFDAFRELPYVRFRGDYGAGKTRMLLALGSICYKPIFASGASTVSPLFHIIDAFQGSLVLDEADLRFSDATAPLTKILNNGNVAGLPVLRTMTNRAREFDPKAFRVFGPKILAMRERFSDDALESRFLTEELTVRPLRPDMPIHTPAALAEEALGLRNQLLAWRFAHLHAVKPEPSRVPKGLEPRMSQVALALASVMDDPRALEKLEAHQHQAAKRLEDERAASIEGEVLSVLMELLKRAAGRPIQVAAVAAALSTRNGAGAPVSAKWVGWVLRTRLKLTTRKSNGVFVLSQEEFARVAVLAKRFGVADADSADEPPPCALERPR